MLALLLIGLTRNLEGLDEDARQSQQHSREVSGCRASKTEH